jgi:hypothetical protein
MLCEENIIEEEHEEIDCLVEEIERIKIQNTQQENESLPISYIAPFENWFQHVQEINYGILTFPIDLCNIIQDYLNLHVAKRKRSYWYHFNKLEDAEKIITWVKMKKRLLSCAFYQGDKKTYSIHLYRRLALGDEEHMKWNKTMKIERKSYVGNYILTHDKLIVETQHSIFIQKYGGKI